MNVKTPFPVKLEAGSDYFCAAAVRVSNSHFVMEVTKVLNTVRENLLRKKQRLYTCAAVKKPQTVRSATEPITIWDCKRTR